MQALCRHYAGTVLVQAGALLRCALVLVRRCWCAAALVRCALVLVLVRWCWCAAALVRCCAGAGALVLVLVLVRCCAGALCAGAGALVQALFLHVPAVAPLTPQPSVVGVISCLSTTQFHRSLERATPLAVP